MKSRTNRTIRVEQLARVEGEGSMVVNVSGGEVAGVELRIFEPPRFFEALLRGRRLGEVPDITARICGICPIAYQISACRAIEDACGVELDEPLRRLRRLLMCGEWIESHTLHIYMLHAPDFLGYHGAVDMAVDHRAEVSRGLRIKKAGNAIIATLAGREIHPINMRVGGFYRAPRRAELEALVDDLERARDEARETVRWVSRFEFPELERDYELVSMSHPTEYPMCEGPITSSRGIAVEAASFNEVFAETQVAHSNALHAAVVGRGAYLTGPLARYGQCSDRLSPLAAEAAREAGLGAVCRNPFKSIVVRAVEVLYAIDEALRIIGDYREPERPALEAIGRDAVGHGCSEAPRGLLYHRYAVGADGLIADAQIVPPTSQNQPSIERDLLEVARAFVDEPVDRLTRRCEQSIRNHDPCISCATHFLDLRVVRS